MAEIEECIAGWRLFQRHPLMLFDNDFFSQNANLLYHQQAQIADNICRQRFIGDIASCYIEAEILALDTTPIGEIDLEVEFDAPVVPILHICESPIAILPEPRTK